MERRTPYACPAVLLRGLLLVVALLADSLIHADDAASDQVAPSPAVVNELFSEPDELQLDDLQQDEITPEEAQPEAVETPTPEPVQPTPIVEPAVTPEPSVPTPQTLWQDRPIASLKATLNYTKGDLPPNKADPRIAEAALMSDTFGDIRPWVLSNCEWEAPATRHLPLLFEEPNLERMGYTHICRPNRCEERSRPRMAECMQPLVSGAHFAGNLVMIPYRCGYQPLCEPVYTLGVDRPGSPVCDREHQMPLSLRGSLYQAGFITGLVFLIP